MRSKNKILVTGANGQLGSEIRQLETTYPKYDFCFTDYAELSIMDEHAITQFFNEYQPDYCINCAAYTAVDNAEEKTEFELVEKLNASAVGFLARSCEQHNTKFIHVSTDYVFDGSASMPYKETDIPKPVSVYGITKLKGEELALQYTDAIIIRTAWVYSSFGKNFVKTMMRLMQEKPSISVVNDQYGTPTYAADLAKTILQIISADKWLSGIYHYTDEGIITWFDFASAINKIKKYGCEILPIPTSSYPTPAQRPAYSVLDKSKIKEAYNIQVPAWEDSLATCLKRMEKANLPSNN